jgi:hypothetical protein
MARQSDVRRIALTLPETSEGDNHFAFSVMRGGKHKGFAWTWNERVVPKKPRVPNPKVLAVRVADLSEKEMLLASDDEVFFTEPHYDGFPAVLVRLAAIPVKQLEALLIGAWRCQAPRALVEAYDDGAKGPVRRPPRTPPAPRASRPPRTPRARRAR